MNDETAGKNVWSATNDVSFVDVSDNSNRVNNGNDSVVLMIVFELQKKNLSFFLFFLNSKNLQK